MAPGAAQSLEQLRERLPALRQESHWCCNGEFLELCGTTYEEVEPCVKKWWGNKDLWLDMLATEIGKELGLAAGLEALVGAGWAIAAEEWLDGAYRRATEGVRCAPVRQVLRQKAKPHIERVLRSAGGRKERAPLMVRHANVVTISCESCGQDFSQRLGKCPSCFPRAPPPAKASAAASAAEAAAAWRRLPSANIEESLPWAEALRATWRDGNSGGVFLVELPSGAVCVKGGACTVGDYFSQCLANKLGVRVAPMRVVPAISEENLAIRSALKRVAAEDGELLMQVRTKLKSYDLAVVEFVDGHVMMGMAANQLLRPAEGAGLEGRWRQLGRLAALDLLLNNLDRLPLAWTNEGNLGNIMLGARQGAVVGIDQSVHPISHPDGLRRYLERAGEAAAEARDGEGPRFEAVRGAIRVNTGVAPTSDELRDLRAGCAELLAEVLRLAASEELEPLLQAVSDETLRAFADAVGGGEESRGQVAAFCGLIRDVVSAVQGVFVGAPTGAGPSA